MSDKLVVIKKPAILEKKARSKRTLDTLWPKIVDHVSNNPAISNDDLFLMYAGSCGETDKVRFIRRLKLRGLKDLRSSLKDKRDRNSSRQLTERTVMDIEQRRKKGGVRLITKMDRVVRRASTSLDKQSIEVLEGGEDAPHLGDHIINIKNLVKVGKELYNIDAEGNENRAKMNVAVLMSFNPLEHQSEVIDI